MAEMAVAIAVREARSREIDWVNNRYDSIGFPASDFEREIIAIAEWDGERAGLSRIIRIGADVAEVGGTFVLPPFRGLGIAKQLLRFLNEKSAMFSSVYALPFVHVTPLYRELGFSPVDRDAPDLPPDIIEKIAWFDRNFAREVRVMRRQR